MCKHKEILAIILALLLPQQASAACATHEEITAFNTRVLQSDLMVAAFSCGEKQRYNSFMGRFQPELTAGGQTVREYFKRVYSSDSEKMLNSFITRLANDSSRQSLKEEKDAYCMQSDKLFESALSVSRGQLKFIAEHMDLTERHGITPCSAEASRNARLKSFWN